MSLNQESRVKKLDLITIGRASVDLYGGQVGGRLEDMRSFSKYIGGSPTNIAAGSARLGLRSALITRVGDEHMGRFVREQLEREGVDVTAVKTDPERLTALAILGIRNEDSFPLIFYRENCADMGIQESDIDPEFIASAKCVCATGTHLSNPRVETATRKAVELAREFGVLTALDIDYRPNLWGLAGHGAGEGRYIESSAVTMKLQSTLHLFDLIVGTEEEFHIAGGSTDTIQALRSVRKISDAVLVCKRGSSGAVAFEGPVPNALDQGIPGKGFEIEIFNVVGAGDGFMSGLLKGWLTGQEWETSLEFANACGAFSVSRHGCTPSYPSWEELAFFLERGVRNPALREDTELEQIHWSTTRSGEWPRIRIFAFDREREIVSIARAAGCDERRVSQFLRLCLDSVLAAAEQTDGMGIVCNNELGRWALYEAAGSGLWIGRPATGIHGSGLNPEEALGPNCRALTEWPESTVARATFRSLADDPLDVRRERLVEIERLFHATRAENLELAIEIDTIRDGRASFDDAAFAVSELYNHEIRPDWWILEAYPDRADWAELGAIIKANDPYARGGIINIPDRGRAELQLCFGESAASGFVRGFQAGELVYRKAAEGWFAGEVNDQNAVSMMTDSLLDLSRLWDEIFGP